MLELEVVPGENETAPKSSPNGQNLRVLSLPEIRLIVGKGRTVVYQGLMSGK